MTAPQAAQVAAEAAHEAPHEAQHADMQRPCGKNAPRSSAHGRNENARRTVTGGMRALMSLTLLLAVAYAALTAYAGFRVARGIDDAKASSVLTRVGARLLGRDEVENVAIRKGGIPPWIARSPAFWMALRANE